MRNKRTRIISYLSVMAFILTACLKPLEPQEGMVVHFEGNINQADISGQIISCHVDTQFKLDRAVYLPPPDEGKFWLIHKGSILNFGDCKKVRFRNYVGNFNLVLDAYEVKNLKLGKSSKEK
ncbi:MAG: hypothetical protein WC744_02100 [Patescibacteria group bacterium]